MFSALLFTVSFSIKDTDWQPLVLKWDLSKIKEMTNTCDNSSQFIWWNNTEHSCPGKYVPSDNKKNNLESTLNEISTFLNKFLRVPYGPTKIQIKNVPGIIEGIERNYNEDAHLVISVIVRPFMIKGQNNANRMFGLITNKNDTTKRPIAGILALDQAYFDEFDKGKSTESSNNYYYYKLLSLTFRILGLDSSCFDDYHTYDSNKPHNAKGNTCNVTNKYNKTFKYLKTPFAQTFFTNHYLNERASDQDPDCYGIELDDFAGRDDILNSSQIYSSPVSRVYYSDVNAYADFYTISSDRYKANLNKRITDVTVVMLRDTGFYQVNYNLAYPLIWGNTETGVQFNNFSTGTPSNWPRGNYYLSSDYTSGQMPSFDFKMRLSANNLPSSKVTCPNSSPDFCKAQEWYQGTTKDGLNIDLNNLAFDYIYQPKYYDETTKLEVNQAFIRISAGVTDSKPFNYTCEENNTKVTFQPTSNDTVKFTCTAAGEKHEYKVSTGGMNTTAICPDPKIFCKTTELYNNAFNETTNPLKEKDIESNNKELKIILAVVIPLVIIIILIIVGIVILSRYRIAKKRRQQEDFNRLKAIAASVKNRKRSATSATTGKRPPPPVAGGAAGAKKRTRASTTAAAPKSFTDAPPDPNEKKEEKTAKGDKLNQILFIEQLEKNREANQKKDAEEKPQDVENAKATDDLLPPGETRPRKNSL